MSVGKLDIGVRKTVKVRQKIYDRTCGILSLKLFHYLHVHVARTYFSHVKGLLTFDI